MSMFLVKQRFEQYLQKVALLYSPHPPPKLLFAPVMTTFGSWVCILHLFSIQEEQNGKCVLVDG